MTTRRQLTVSSTTVLAVVALIAGCDSSGAPTPTSTPTVQVGQVAVTAVATGATTDCTLDPYIIAQGPVSMTVTATGRVPVSVSIFAPDEGAFTKRLARVRILRSGESKAINLRLALGAYEVECASSGRSTRARLTAV